MVAFGNYRHHVCIKTDETVGRGLASRKHVARNDAGIVGRGLQVVLKHRSHRSTVDKPVVLGIFHLGACDRDDFGSIDAPFVQQAADDGQILNIHRPHPLVLVDRIDVMNLNAYITYRMLACKRVDFGPFQRCHFALRTGTHAQMDLTRSELAHRFDTRFEVPLLTGQHEIVIRSQRCGIERRNENGLRCVARIGDDTVRPLDNHGPKPRLEQKIDNLFAGSGLHIQLGKLFVHLGRIGLDRHVENATLLTAIDRRNRTADGRGENHPFVVLVEEQRGTRLDPVAGFHQQLGRHTLEIERRHSVLGSERQFDQLLHGLTLKIDVETFA